ncbi:MAG: hypothetical protein K9I95_04640 [Flavobacteriaceae bacterium]|nr:hypothetical protein [Flavobacteriaceae bacterium]
MSKNMPKINESNNIQLSLNLKSIEVKEFSFKTPSKEKEEEVLSNLRFDLTSSYESLVKDDIFNSILTITFKREDENDIIEYVKLQVEFVYYVSPLKEITHEVNKDGKVLTAFNNNNILGTLLGISYSTLRGVFFEKTSNTIFKKIVLPIVDPTVLFRNKQEK